MKLLFETLTAIYLVFLYYKSTLVFIYISHAYKIEPTCKPALPFPRHLLSAGGGVMLPDGDILHSPSPSSEITSVSTPSVPSCTVSLASYSIPTITS